MSKHLIEIITRLGYANSPCLKYKSENYDYLTLTAHTNKVLNTLSPFAAYMVDDEPFVLFFHETSSQDEQKDINERIWNAQIPVVIFCGTSSIKIFNGCTIEQRTHMLTEAETVSFDEINENSPFSFWEITDQSFWEKYSQRFIGKKLNDALLENLTYLTDKLRNDYKISFATKLVLQLIFIRYLIDRGVDLDYSGFSSNVAVSRLALLELLDDGTGLHKLFSHLKEKFNGNLFEPDSNNPNSLTKAALAEIRDFLSADISTRSGQLSLFALYDFNIIPVELIGNIYEILLGKEARHKDNAFYTPKYLVDYILDMTIDEHIKEKGTCKILDPSCGSGVFLVDSYRRMIENKLNGELYTENNAFLCDTLKNNIFGIDLNPSAIDVAIFSLYLAVLDYKNPKTLKHFSLPNLRGSNLLVCDFFDEEKLEILQATPFDFIIGNPPWGSKDGMHMDYCLKHGYKQYMQNKDTCRAFILRSKDFCANNNTNCCFVLKSKMLYMQKQQSKNFRNFLLSNTKIIRLIELSSVRGLIFKNADAPAIILSYKFSDENTIDNRFEYISMKKNEFFRLFNIIVVEKTDIKSVQQKLLLENDWAWKTLVYGFTGDIDNILNLKSVYKTVKQAVSSQQPKLLLGAGVEYQDGDLKDANHLRNFPFLASDAINHFNINVNKVTEFTKFKVHRPRDERLFHAPYCLLLTGIDTNDYTMRAVYCDTDFVFRKAVYAIKGCSEQEMFLKNLTALFNSTLFSYFNLLVGSSLGVEREQRLFKEVLAFPYIFSDDIVAQVNKIQEIKIKNSEFVVQDDASYEIDVLNQTILEAFGLSHNEFVDYVLSIQIPQLTGKNNKDAKRKAIIQDFEIYSKAFYDYLSEIFAPVEKHIQINIYTIVAKHYSAIEVYVLDEKPEEWLTVVDTNADRQKIMLANLSAHKINELFYTVKDVLYFEENSFYIIKPNYYKNWHLAIAQLDLMDATDQILSRKTGGEE